MQGEVQSVGARTATSWDEGRAKRTLAAGDGWSVREVVCRAGPSDRPFEERHDGFSVSAVIEGSFTYRSDAGHGLLYPGALLLGNNGWCFECAHAHGIGDRCISLNIHEELFGEIAAAAASTSRFRFSAASLPPSPKVAAVSWRVMEALSSTGVCACAAKNWPCGSSSASSAAMAGERRFPAAPTGREARRVVEAIRLVESDAARPLQLKEMAAIAGMSKYHFLRVFRRLTGVTPHQYLISARMRRAALALASSRRPVIAIALDSGFGDLSTFNKTLSRHVRPDADAISRLARSEARLRLSAPFPSGQAGVNLPAMATPARTGVLSAAAGFDPRRRVGAGLARRVLGRARARGRGAALLPLDSGRGDGRRRAQSRGRPRAGPVAAGADDAVFAALAWMSRARPFALGLSLASPRCSPAFLSMSLRTARVAAPVLDRIRIVTLQGFVEEVDLRTVGARMVIGVVSADGMPREKVPRRVRVTTRNTPDVAAGDFVELKARLLPPSRAALPGGYDFARDAFFAGVGAVGSTLGPIRLLPPPGDASLGQRFNAAIDHARNRLALRVNAIIGGDEGAIAAAMVTGKRDFLSNDAKDLIREAGIFHIITISGVQMTLVAGIFFVVTRRLLALSPTLALNYPIKKWAARVAMAGSLFYDIATGSRVGTERALIMTLIVLGAVIMDRRALTMRNLAFAVLAVVAIEPEAILGVSFQLSFAAVAALVAVMEARLAAAGRRSRSVRAEARRGAQARAPSPPISSRSRSRFSSRPPAPPRRPPRSWPITSMI